VASLEKAHPFGETGYVGHSGIVLAVLHPAPTAADTYDLEDLMRTITTLISAPLILILGFAASARAQERHVVSPSALAAAVADHVAARDADREAIREALKRPEVRAVAERTGIDIDRAAASIDSLDASSLVRAAESARQVNQALVGGSSTITISTTTIIIVLLIIILILVAAH
jgi:hypothetical protein